MLQDLEQALLGPAASPHPARLAAATALMSGTSFETRARAAVKRTLDVMLAVVAIVAMAPLMLAIALLVKLDSPGSAFFRQRRIGKDMRPFSMLKFRTMACDASSDAHEGYIAELANGRGDEESTLKKLLNDPRVTRLGAILRKSSLDELPQLFNVLLGHMAIVGPRPAIVYELEHYALVHYLRFGVRPGLTGLWQVSGRSQLGFREMLDLDAEYALDVRLLTDLRIMALTPRATIGRTA